jgi:hypothetical protein
MLKFKFQISNFHPLFTVPVFTKHLVNLKLNIFYVEMNKQLQLLVMHTVELHKNLEFVFQEENHEL